MKNKRNPTLVAIKHFTEPVEEDLMGTPEEIDEWFDSLEGANHLEDEEYEPTPEEQILEMFDPFITAPTFSKGLLDDDYPF